MRFVLVTSIGTFDTLADWFHVRQCLSRCFLVFVHEVERKDVFKERSDDLPYSVVPFTIVAFLELQSLDAGRVRFEHRKLGPSTVPLARRTRWRTRNRWRFRCPPTVAAPH
jgi:hypothetical protein